MNNKLWIIFLKEVKGIFSAPSFYVVCFFAAAFFSFFFPLQLQEFSRGLQIAAFQPGAAPQQLNIHYGVFVPFLSILNIIMVFAIPSMVIKILSEERKTRSFDLLLTSPVTSFQIVFGKYLATLAVVIFLSGISLLYPLTMIGFVKIFWPVTLSAYGGLLLIGAIYAALSLFCSSLTESTVTAFVMAVLLNFFIWLFAQVGNVVDDPAWRSVIEHLTLGSHIEGFLRGSLSVTAFVYILSFIGFFVFLAERVVESQRWR